MTCKAMQFTCDIGQLSDKQRARRQWLLTEDGGGWWPFGVIDDDSLDLDDRFLYHFVEVFINDGGEFLVVPWKIGGEL